METSLLYAYLNRSLRILVALVLVPWLVLNTALAKDPADGARSVNDYQTIEWTDLMPEDDLEAILNPPEYLDDIVDGSPEDQLTQDSILAAPEMETSVAMEESDTLALLDNSAKEQRYQEALTSVRVVEAFDGKAIRVPGFIVPLEFAGDQQRVTRFFLVPYFGACIHVPPPPPNQIIYAEYDKGLKLESLYDPFWLSGVLSTTLIENDMATAAYVIKVDRLEPYTE
jgi:hypothetical protein